MESVNRNNLIICRWVWWEESFTFRWGWGERWLYGSAAVAGMTAVRTQGWCSWLQKHELAARSQGKKGMMVAGAWGPQTIFFFLFSCIQPCSLKAETVNLFTSGSLSSCSWHVLSFQSILQLFLYDGGVLSLINRLCPWFGLTISDIRLNKCKPKNLHHTHWITGFYFPTIRK